jgi:uncharacterized integral membrane protein (TIGR00698 family)
MIFTRMAGRWLGVDTKLAELIAAGTSICGASAIIAANTVTEARDEDVAHAVTCITIFGTVAMFLCPVVGAALHLSAHEYGLWIGASVHEIAQVVAAAFQQSQVSGEFGTVAKLMRVMLLALMLMVIGWTAMHRRGSAVSKAQEWLVRLSLPWFVWAFWHWLGSIAPSHLTPPSKPSPARQATSS